MVGRPVALVPQVKWLVAALAVIGALVIAPAAQAAPPAKVLGEEVECKTLPLNGEITGCSGIAHTFDGTKLDINVFLPPESTGPGPFPLIGDFHGWGGSKQGLSTVEPVKGLTLEQKDSRIQHWAEEGYAVFSMSDRGWGLSCGVADEDRIKKEPDCANGYNHLMDDRYEVRDAQYLISELADEGLVQPKKIGATGASYGGGISVALGVLRNREMRPGGELVPWVSPQGKQMEFAATVPQWAWTDLAYALAPNGRNLDYVTDSSYRGPLGKNPIGIMKYTYTEALYIGGEKLSNYAGSPIPGWRLRLYAGEPYSDAASASMIEQLTAFHSAFYINAGEAPAPMLLQSGWNDDLFPPDEALRMYQRTRADYPDDPVSLFFADYGHSRSQNKPDDVALFNQRLEAWFAHYLKGEGPAPSSSVEALTTTCPNSASSAGPYTAANWSSLAPGEIRLRSSGSQTIEHGTPTEEQTPTESGVVFDPILGPEKLKSTVCSSVPDAGQPHSVAYRLAPAPAGGFTLMGSPTVIAKIQSPSPNSEIAARLLDVAPGGTETLIARGLYRPSGGIQEMVFQLHPQGYHFAAGHVAKLELMPSDVPYGRPSNIQTNINVNGLELRLPVMEQPGSLGGLVQTPAPKVVPPGYTLAAEYEQKATPSNSPGPTPNAPPAVKVGFGAIAGKLTANRRAILVPVRCSSDGACTGSLSFSTKKSGKKGGRRVIARRNYSLALGTARNVKLPLTKAGRKIVKKEILAKKKRKLPGQLRFKDTGRATTLTLSRAVKLPRGK